MTTRTLSKTLGAALCCAAFATGSVQAATNVIGGYLTGTNSWYRTNVYQLNGMVFVRSNGVLNIEAGTVIKGHNLGSGDTNISALVICRGAKIYAEGTAQNPIIFTAEADDTSLPDDLPLWGPTARGLWGGVVILGRTTINSALNAAGHAATPKYEVYEGLLDLEVDGERLLRLGGDDDNDNSGVLRYVSIRHGGAVLAPNKEINGLSLGAVGRGTTIEFVEAYGFADDGFEFFGGTVNTKYLVSAFNDDDSFDTDMGYRGTNQFWFGIQAPDKRNFGMELNSQLNEIVTTNQLLPQGDFKVYNLTLIGAGASSTNVNGGNDAAVILRPFASPKIYNAIFTDFNERGVQLDTQQGVNAAVSVTNGYAQFHNTLWWDFVTGSGNTAISNTATNLGRGTVATNYWTDLSLTNQIADPQLTSISRTNVGTFLDPRPKTGSPALSNAAPTPAGLSPATYRGAFGANDLWIASWTALAEYGILQAAGTKTNIVAGYLTGTNSWYRTNVYQLNGMVFVRSNGVLNIEAGTVIKGHNLGSGDTNISALVICRGAKIYAEGTAQNPIIFTAEADDTSLPDDLPLWGPTARGLWGGVVILGRTTINSALNAAGHAATPKYEVYEGLLDLEVDGERLLRLGGDDDNDNSGVLRYVSIRHGGAVLAPNKEINGLSLGAVGRGTTIEFVEAYGFADDGFEFFGGTVNTKYLVSAFNDDDSFDTDMGYRGTNQFWFGIQAPDKRNFGMELNSQLNEIVTTNQLLPQGDFKVYNLTLIGAGASSTNVNGGNDAAVILRPFASPKIYNAIFTDFNERGVQLDTQQGVNAAVSVTNGYAQFHNTLWWDFVTGSGNTAISNTATNLGRGTVATNYWTDLSLTNQIADPQLTSISRTNVGTFLDPRPKTGSPALSNAAPTPAGLSPATYRGAFGANDLWIASWTALAEYGILQAAGTKTNIVAGYLTGTNSWYRTNVYQLNGMVFVRSNGVLNIEAGTVIKGHNLGSGDTNISALVICRGAKIYAEGTAQNPIIFTAEADDTSLPDDLPLWGPTARGLWGGVVILGRTTINSALNAAGHAATPKYEVYEGLLDLEVDGERLLRLGGDDDNDNSGVLRYVSIRHGGAVLAPNKEINGLSLGAVGRGTTIEFVEAYGFADDGFEFFGGTVNTKYLVSAFNDDDSFDTDMGYRGTNQFWFGIQAPDKRNFGMELNSQLNEIVTTNQLLPQGDFKVYNLTLIGAGASSTNVNGGNDAAVILRPFASPKIYNAIFTDFNERGVQLDTQQGVNAAVSVTNGYAQFHNTLWWDFVTGSGNTAISNTATNLGRGTVATNYWTDLSLTNQIADPQLTSISRTNVGTFLDPRPKTGSPALSNAAPTPAGLSPATYRGAFGDGRGNWAADWTALGEYGIVTGDGGVIPTAIAAAAVAPATPLIMPSFAGGNLSVVIPTQTGVTYQWQSRTNFTDGWADEGTTFAGTGGPVTNFFPAIGNQKYFRVGAQ